MKNKLLFLLVLYCFSIASAVAQDVSSIALAQAPFDDEGKRSCGYSALMISYIDELSEEEIQVEIAQEIASYEESLKNNESDQSQEIQKSIIKDLKALQTQKDTKSKLKEAFKTSCTVALGAADVSLRTTALSASLITSTLTLPVTFVVKFGVGIFKRKVNEKQGPGLSEILGGQNTTTNLSTLGYQLVKTVFFNGSPWSLAIMTIVSVDVKAAEMCKKVNPKNEREVRFCKNYKLIKKNEFEFSQKGAKAGVIVGNKLLKVLDFRSDEELNPGLCNLSAKKKFKIARRAQERLVLLLKEKNIGFKETKIHLYEDGCLALNVITENTESEIPGTIDGIPYLFNFKPEVVTKPKTEEICQIVEEYKIFQAKNKPAIQAVKKESFLMGLNIENSASALFTPVNNEHLIRQPLNQVGVGKNIVFMVAPTPEQMAEFEEVEPLFKSIQLKIKKERKKFKKLLRTNSKEECLAKNDEVGFDYPAFLKLSNSLNDFKVVKAVEDFRGMRKEAKKAGRELFVLNDLKNKWELQGLTSFNELKDALIDEQVANIVIVSHGQTNGKLVDSRFNELPHNVLNWMNPNLLSVSFFSCHSKAAIINYGFEDKLKSQPSYHPVRFSGSVNTSALLEENNQAPTKALSQFIVSIDKDIALALKGTQNVQVLGRNHLPEGESLKVCEIKLDNIAVEKGAFSVKLNSNWIGTLYPEMRVNTFKYPCSWIKEEDNSVFLEGSSLIEKSTIKSSEMQANVEGQQIKPSKITRREDESISTVRFLFNKTPANE